MKERKWVASTLLLCLWAATSGPIGCSGSGSDDDSSPTGDTGDDDTSQAGDDDSSPIGDDDDSPTGDDDSGSTGDDDSTDSGEKSSCSSAWEDIGLLYEDVDLASLGDCTGNAAAERATSSLMNLTGITIDNQGDEMTPCIEAMCDDTYVYVSSNALPHYDYVSTTPNELVENRFIWRFRIVPQAISSSVEADDATALGDPSNQNTGCYDAYAAVIAGGDYTEREPSGMCYYDDQDKAYLTEELSTGTVFYHKLPCLATEAFVINGVPIYGPNEGPNPDPWGNPFFSVPNTAGQWDGTSSMLDLCFGHTADAMHYHGLNEACFARDDDGSPANTYAEATTNWNLDQALTADCTEPSSIIGWNLDGYPIMGACVCTERNSDGSCKTVKRARSSWIYQGLRAWGTEDEVAGSSLAKENTSCSSVSDCCPGGGTCDYFCEPVVVAADTASGTDVSNRCVQADYNWCIHQYKDRTTADVTDESFVYLDRCNGYDGPDGYAYYATATFPYVPACYRGEPSDSTANGGNAGGDDGGTGGGGTGGGTGGGDEPVSCDAVPEGQPCCGDGMCDGPETHDNCAADCKS